MGHKHDYNLRLPMHYCGECSHVVFTDDLVCPSCATSPAKEWPSIQDGFDPWLGRVLDGRYVITRRIGQGAMATVYKAESLAISRRFAVKVINFKEGTSGLDPAQIRARLHREIEAIGRLRNPHVVPFYEVIELFDHFVGIVMDFIDGSTLDAAVRRHGPLTARRSLQILRQVANGVHEAHEFGMIHRDLKPDNIMIETLPAGDDFAHVLDFGIVHLDDGVSMTKGFLGTPLYASPEQAMGGGTLDRRSDVYSLGAVLFYMVTGHAPFESDNVYEILQAHVRKPVPTLGEVFGRPFSSRMESLVASMLSKSPEKRPQSLAEVIQTIDRILSSVDIDESAPDSLELVMSGSNVDTLTGLSEESSSFFESAERDRTGPKAAIFRLGSRSGVHRALDDDRRSKQTAFDRVYQGNTGTSTLGIAIHGDVRIGACAPDGSLLLQTTDDLEIARDGQASTLARAAQVTALAVSESTALGGTADGQLMELLPTAAVELFQDVRRAPITACAMSLHDEVWLAGSESGRVYQCVPANGKRVWVRVSDGPAIAAISIDAKAETFAVARRHGEIELAYLHKPKNPFLRFSVGGAAIRGVAMSGGSQLVAVLFADDSVAVHLVTNGQPVHKLRDERNRIFAIGFVDERLLGYFVLDGRIYARQLDRAATPN